LRIEALEIADEVLEKVERRHGVELHEVEEACLLTLNHVRRGRQGLYQVFGKSDSGRRLFVVLADKGGGVWQVVTARDMTGRERRLYDRHIGG